MAPRAAHEMPLKQGFAEYMIAGRAIDTYSRELDRCGLGQLGKRVCGL
jgi:hypothetical protein